MYANAPKKGNQIKAMARAKSDHTARVNDNSAQNKKKWISMRQCVFELRTE